MGASPSPPSALFRKLMPKAFDYTAPEGAYIASRFIIHMRCPRILTKKLLNYFFIACKAPEWLRQWPGQKEKERERKRGRERERGGGRNAG